MCTRHAGNIRVGEALTLAAGTPVLNGEANPKAGALDLLGSPGKLVRGEIL